ncbi:MAG: orotidine-5'-phosphate decarboxylase [Candidatus Berkiella sp.]
MSAVSNKIIIALDFEDEAPLNDLLAKLNPKQCRLKVGKTLFTQYGPQWVAKLQAQGFEVFLDLKFHDIPQQVGGACYAAAKMGVWMTNVHASGGMAMLKAAKAGVDKAAKETGKRTLLIGVTLLTSLTEQDAHQIGFSGTSEECVMRLAKLCFDAGLDGVVCSANEAVQLKKIFGPDFLCVTPGIRLAEDDKQDQQRVMTPENAIKAGSDYLVIGRSITHAKTPTSVLNQIHESIAAI